MDAHHQQLCRQVMGARSLTYLVCAAGHLLSGERGGLSFLCPSFPTPDASLAGLLGKDADAPACLFPHVTASPAGAVARAEPSSRRRRTRSPLAAGCLEAEIARLKGTLSPGAVPAPYVRCGRRRCQSGQLHGPFCVARWREDGRIHQTYLVREAPQGRPRPA